MKCEQAGTDCEAEIEVFANGWKCEEYQLLSARSAGSKSNLIECYIPVSEGSTLTLRGNFSGTVLHTRLDLIADGVYVNDRLFEGNPNGTLTTHSKKRVIFNKVISVTDHGLPTSSTNTNARQITRGNLQVEHFNSQFVGVGQEITSRYPLGSVAVSISKNLKFNDKYRGDFLSFDRGKPAHCTNPDMIPPTYQLGIEDSGNDPGNTSYHKRLAEELRFGSEPWAIFIFHYRTHNAIQEAQCPLLPTSSHQLPPLKSKNSRARSSATNKKGTGPNAIISQTVIKDNVGNSVPYVASGFVATSKGQPHKTEAALSTSLPGKPTTKSSPLVELLRNADPSTLENVSIAKQTAVITAPTPLIPESSSSSTTHYRGLVLEHTGEQQKHVGVNSDERSDVPAWDASKRQSSSIDTEESASRERRKRQRSTLEKARTDHKEKLARMTEYEALHTARRAPLEERLRQAKKKYARKVAQQRLREEAQCRELMELERLNAEVDKVLKAHEATVARDLRDLESECLAWEKASEHSSDGGIGKDD